MNEEYARKMVKDVDAARLILKQLKGFEQRDEPLILGHRVYNYGYNFIEGVTIPKWFEETFFFSLKTYAEEILGKYELDK